METLLEYKCPACGGAILFDSSTQKMKCPFCNTRLELEALQEWDAALREEKPSDFTWKNQPQGHWSDEETKNLQGFICQSCGGEILGDLNTIATHCPYCDNPVVVADRVSGMLRPDLVVPFQLNKSQAKDALAAYLKKKPLLPKSFKEKNRIENIQGIYVPFWLFNADVDVNIRYRATRVRRWSDSNYNYIRTSHYSLLRSGTIAFDHVPVDASSRLSNTLMESVEPYDLSQAVDFQTAYLAGYLADKFDVAVEDCQNRANDRIRVSTEAAFAETTGGYSTVIPEYSDIQLRSDQVRYALLPVWILTTHYAGKNYTFAMNGQTGKMVGDLPIDWNLFVTYLLSIGIGSGALISLIMSLLG